MMRVRVDDHAAEEVVSLKNNEHTGLAGSLRIGVTSDKSHLLLRDTGARKIYALDSQEP